MKKAIYAFFMSMLVIMTGCMQDEDVKPDGNGRTGNHWPKWIRPER